MPEVEPITREEKLWSGENIEPITREEQYIKHIFDKTQNIPSKPITRKEMLLEKAGEGGGSDVTIKQLSVTENGTYSEENTAYSPVIVNVPAPPIPDNAYLLNEVEGLPKDIVTFDDGVSLPMPSLKAGINPIQDLHGYDYPWAGGAGKNKLPMTVSGIKALNTEGTWNGNVYTIYDVTFTLVTDADGNVLQIEASGTPTVNNANIYLPIPTLEENSEYILSGCPSGGASAKYRLAFSNSNMGAKVEYGDGVTFTYSSGTNEDVYIRIAQNYAISGTLVYKPMIRLSTETSTYEPYSNICPISGFTEANVTRCGVNVWDEDWEVGTINRLTGANLSSTDAIRAKNFNRCKGGQSYYCKIANYSLYWLMIIWYDENQNYISGEYCGRQIVTSPNNATYFKVATNTNASSQYGSTYNNDISINYPSTDTEYHAYNGNTYKVEFKDGSNPLTVYSGSLDVINGIVTPCPYYASYNGEQLIGEWISDRDVYSPNTSPTIGAQVVNIGTTGTPFSVQPSSVKSLLGSNNVWADTGDIEELEYFSKEA